MRWAEAVFGTETMSNHIRCFNWTPRAKGQTQSMEGFYADM